jgi:hypothetical protein
LVLTLDTDGDWMAWLGAARADIASVERLHFLRTLKDPHRRNQRLLEWIEQHRHEFGSVNPEQNGWGDLETEVFDWVLASAILEDCWAAVRLFAELNHGAIPSLKAPVFGTREGRDFLLRIVLDEKVLTSSRVRALHLLGDSVTPVTDAEAVAVLDKLLPFLAETDESFRAATVRCLQRLAQETSSDGDRKRTLEALVKAYQTEQPGPVRDDLAEAVCLLGGPERWQQLTGNPASIRVHVRDLTRSGNKVSFWLGMPAGQMTVMDCPTLVLERLNREGLPAEKKTMLLPTTVQPTPWNTGWDGRSYLPVQFPIEGFTAGTWRVRVEGAGKKDQDMLKWTAEPKTFVVEATKNTRPGRSDNILDKIRGIFEMKK